MRASSRKNGASVRAEVSQILSSAEWSTWGAGRGGNSRGGEEPQVVHGGAGGALADCQGSSASVGISEESSDLKGS